VASAGLAAVPALALLVPAVLILSSGECLYDSIFGPLVADLAPEGLAGRYLAASGFAWQLGFIVGPGIGAALLGAEPYALWALTGALMLVVGAGALRLDGRLPAASRTTPRR
jgi:hypothetical protein